MTKIKVESCSIPSFRMLTTIGKKRNRNESLADEGCRHDCAFRAS